jgi:hypothetical protein
VTTGSMPRKSVHARILTGIDGAFVCSTLMEMRALSKLGEVSLPTRELPLYKALVTSFRTLTHQ